MGLIRSITLLIVIELFAVLMLQYCTVWNYTPSVTLGLYLKYPCTPGVDDMVVYSGPDGYRRLAEERHYVRPGDDFIKPVVAAEGDFVCIRDGSVTVNGKVLGEIQKVDSKGNYLPQAYLCRPLVLDELFVMSPQKNGYDGRYFGVLKGSDVKACGVHLF